MQRDGDPLAVRVTAADVAAAADARTLEWVRVAARALPLLGTVSKAKRARKSGELTLNGSALVPTNVPAVVGDEIAYAPRAAAACGSLYAPELQAGQVGGGEERQEAEAEAERGGGDAEARKWAAVCARQGLRRVFERNDMAVVVKPGAVRRGGVHQR